MDSSYVLYSKEDSRGKSQFSSVCNLHNLILHLDFAQMCMENTVDC